MSQSQSDLYPGVRRAYRLWRLDVLNPTKLYSVTQDGFWPTKELTAECKTWHHMDVPHDAPHENCNCGIYAKYHLEDVWEEVRTDSPIVFGAIDVYGKVAEHERGLRAKKAKIRGLYVTSIRLRGLRDKVSWKLREAYDVDVFDSEKGLLTAYPPDKDIPESEYREVIWSPDGNHVTVYGGSGYASGGCGSWVSTGGSGYASGGNGYAKASYYATTIPGKALTWEEFQEQFDETKTKVPYISHTNNMTDEDAQEYLKKLMGE